VTDGKLVLLSFVNELLRNEDMDKSAIMEQVLGNAFIKEKGNFIMCYIAAIALCIIGCKLIGNNRFNSYVVGYLS